jgi:hypothetical protein
VVAPENSLAVVLGSLDDVRFVLGDVAMVERLGLPAAPFVVGPIKGFSTIAYTEDGIHPPKG